MLDKTKELLSIILPDEEDQMLWLNSYNEDLGMYPAIMINDGKESDLFAYLHYAVHGPY